jgi:hypothetical protein
MESQICSVQLMAYIAMSHGCVVGGLQHGRLLRGEHTVHQSMSIARNRIRVGPGHLSAKSLVAINDKIQLSQWCQCDCQQQHWWHSVPILNTYPSLRWHGSLSSWRGCREFGRIVVPDPLTKPQCLSVVPPLQSLPSNTETQLQTRTLQ